MGKIKKSTLQALYLGMNKNEGQIPILLSDMVHFKKELESDPHGTTLSQDWQIKRDGPTPLPLLS